MDPTSSDPEGELEPGFLVGVRQGGLFPPLFPPDAPLMRSKQSRCSSILLENVDDAAPALLASSWASC